MNTGCHLLQVHCHGLRIYDSESVTLPKVNQKVIDTQVVVWLTSPIEPFGVLHA